MRFFDWYLILSLESIHQHSGNLNLSTSGLNFCEAIESEPCPTPIYLLVRSRQSNGITFYVVTLSWEAF